MAADRHRTPVSCIPRYRTLLTDPYDLHALPWYNGFDYLGYLFNYFYWFFVTNNKYFITKELLHMFDQKVLFGC